MISERTKKLLCLIIAVSAAVCGLSGCKTPEEYKAEADEKVYDIIGRKWKADYGNQTNFKISDTNSSPNDLQVTKAIPDSGILTLPHAVAIATAHNRQYQTERETLYIEALDLILARHQFEPLLFGGATARYERDGIGGTEAVTGSAEYGFDRLLASGAMVSTRVTAAWIEMLTGNYRSGLASLISAAVTQPLLRGAGSKVVLENLTQAERDTVYQIRSFNRFRQTFVVSIVTQYYYVLQYFDYLQNARSNYDTLVNVYERAEKLAAAGYLPRFELDQASQDKLDAEDIRVQAQQQYEQALDEFKLALSLPTVADIRLDQQELEVLAKAELTIPEFSEDEIIATAMTQRLDLANISDAVDDAERKIVVAADNLRAQFDLLATTEVASEQLRRNMRILKDLKGSVDVGLLLDLPLDRFAEQNVYRKSLIALTQSKRNYEQAVDTVALEVRQAYRELTEAAERHRVQLEALELARKRLDNTLELLQYRRANTRDVLDAQDDLFDAQNAATETLVDYTIAMLNFYRDAGVLQIRPDGMWEY